MADLEHDPKRRIFWVHGDANFAATFCSRDELYRLVATAMFGHPNDAQGHEDEMNGYVDELLEKGCSSGEDYCLYVEDDAAPPAAPPKALGQPVAQDALSIADTLSEAVRLHLFERGSGTGKLKAAHANYLAQLLHSESGAGTCRI
jgi:hypothetical protein